MLTKREVSFVDRQATVGTYLLALSCGHSYDPHRWFDHKFEWECPCASTPSQ